MQIQVGEVALEVEVKGKGEPALVFLHSWGGTHRTWGAVAAELESSFQVVTYDMRGWGSFRMESLTDRRNKVPRYTRGFVMREHLFSWLLQVGL